MELVEHNGKRYRLSDLAHFMEHDQREEIHAGNSLEETDQMFWDRFRERFPEEADRIAGMAPADKCV